MAPGPVGNLGQIVEFNALYRSSPPQVLRARSPQSDYCNQGMGPELAALSGNAPQVFSALAYQTNCGNQAPIATLPQNGFRNHSQIVRTGEGAGPGLAV